MLNYLQYILKEDKNTLISKFFYAQCANQIKNDWVSNIKNVLKEINITFTFQEIQIMKVQTYQDMVESKI